MKIGHDAPRAWLITGVSSGLGLAFAQAALMTSHTVVGNVRQEGGGFNFETARHRRAHAAVLDVSDFASCPGHYARAERGR